MKLQKGDSKLINAWASYDWANSVYSLVISSAIFPVYYNSITTANGSDIVDFFGLALSNSSLLSYSISFAFLVVAVMMPPLSAIADATGTKKRFMQFFCYMGALSCISLFWFSADNVEFGIIASVLASIGFSGSFVFYNAYLPIIAHPEQQDYASAKGYAMGYGGSVILLIFCLFLVMKADLFGITDATLPPRISFVLVGIWWIAFAQISFYYLPNNVFNRQSTNNVWKKGYHELWQVWQQLKTLPRLGRFLLAFFGYMTGVLTVIYLASLFAAKELGMPSELLIATILVIQIFGLVGAYFFNFLAGRIGNIQTLMTACVIWGGICFIGYFVTDQMIFIGLAGLVGFVMGGTQSLSRSTYSKMLPETKDHASFFSFYDVAEKIATVLGSFIFGFLDMLTGSMRISLLVLVIFFVIGFGLLMSLRKSDG